MADDAWSSHEKQEPMLVDAANGGNGVGSGDYDRRTPPPRRSSRSRSPTRNSRDSGEHNPGNNLHVSGLGTRIDARQLEELFSKYGRVQKASVMIDPHTRESRGFGFVTMETAPEAEAAIAGLQGSDIGGRPMNIQKARRGRARTPTPGKYLGPPKRSDRPYDPRPYDSRYDRERDRGDRDRDYYDRRPPPPARYDDRDRGGRYDDRDRGGRYDDRDRGGRYGGREDRYAGGPPPPPRGGAYEERSGGGGGREYREERGGRY